MRGLFVAIGALCSTFSPAFAQKGLEGNFTIETFNSNWVREGGPEIVLKVLSDKDEYGRSLYKYSSAFDASEYKDNKEYLQFVGALSPSVWLRVWSGFTPELGAKWIAENPLLPLATIGFSDHCDALDNSKISTDSEFSIEYLSKRAFLANRNPKLTSEDLGYIRHFYRLIKDSPYLLRTTCEMIAIANKLSKKKNGNELKKAIEATNKVDHQCGSPQENNDRIISGIWKRDVTFSASNTAFGMIKTIEFLPSYYDEANQAFSFGTTSASDSALECLPYYKKLANQTMHNKQIEEELQNHADQEIKNRIIETQSIK